MRITLNHRIDNRTITHLTPDVIKRMVSERLASELAERIVAEHMDSEYVIDRMECVFKIDVNVEPVMAWPSFSGGVSSYALTKDVQEKIDKIIRTQGWKGFIPAIKEARHLTGCPLKEGKQLVEERFDALGVDKYDPSRVR